MKLSEIKDFIQILSNTPDNVLNRTNIFVVVPDKDPAKMPKLFVIEKITTIAEGTMPPRVLIHCKNEHDNQSQ